MLRVARMSEITREPKTFNNRLGFERGFLQHRTGCFARVPKASGFGTTAIENIHIALTWSLDHARK